jgi:hypothetical protein
MKPENIGRNVTLHKITFFINQPSLGSYRRYAHNPPFSKDGDFGCVLEPKAGSVEISGKQGWVIHW